jgi:cell division protein FtsN
LTNQTSPAPGGEPKKVRTVTIRPDGTDVSGRPVSGTQPAGQNNARTPSVARPPAPVTPPPVRGNGGPISLDPQAPGSPPAAAPAARERSAAALPLTPPAPRAPADGPPLAATQPSTGGGSYLVQLSSQKTEAEAHASFRSMQARYPSQLGGRSAVVKRADLGAKGTFYRAMVGPFGSSSEADQFCSSLKAAGGQCLIQRN